MNRLLVAAALGGACLFLDRPVVGATIVEEGRPAATIIVPAAASSTVRHAADELAAYVEKISGAKLPIVAESEPVAGGRIDVGLTQIARRRLPKDFVGDEERVWIETGPQVAVLCGGGDRGTLFAVYRFLETLGCRWLTPEPDNELVPRRKTITLESLHLDTRPAFAWRLFKGDGPPQREQWGLKLGLNGLYAATNAADNGGCVYWPQAIRGVHAYCQIMPPGQYFAAHPDWNPLRAGKRVPTDHQSNQLCVTAPGLADEFAANVIRAFDADPGTPLVSISPNDGRGWCECDACRALDQKLCGGRTTQQGLAREQPFMGDRVFWFANEVADRVAHKYPDKKLLVLAYVNYAEPPDTIKPLANVVPFLCHYAPADYSRAIHDPASEANRQFDDLLRRWMRISPEVMIYSYVSKSMWWRLPRPVLHTFAADVKYYHQLGVRRFYCQSALNDWPLDGPLYYVIAKLLWDPAADPDAVAREWIDAMFGPAATAMAEFYGQVEAAVRATGQPYSDNPPGQVPGLYDAQCLNRAAAALAQAENAAAAEPAIARRVAEVTYTFRYGLAAIECLEHYAKAAQTGDAAQMKAALLAGQKALQSDKNRSGAGGEKSALARESSQLLERFVKSLTMNTDLGVLSSGFGAEETKGGRHCWNSDETGPGDNACGWATFTVPLAQRTRPLVVEMDVWGESDLRTIVINTRPGVWTPLRPEQPLSKKPQWDTLRFRIPPEAFDPERAAQHFGFGGADSQVWVAAIRFRSE